MARQRDILVDEFGDLDIVNGDFVVGESEIQEVMALLQTTTGQIKEDPVLGPNLVSLLKRKADPNYIQQRVRVSLERDGKNYDDIKERITLKTPG